MSRQPPSPPPLHRDLPPAHAQALARLALATAQASGRELFERLVRELAATLEAPLVLLAVVAQESDGRLRTLAVCLDGRILPNFDVDAGALAQPAADPFFAKEELSAAVTRPLSDSAGQPLGMLVAMDRRPMAAAAAGYADAMLEVVAARAAAEIERVRIDETLRAGGAGRVGGAQRLGVRRVWCGCWPPSCRSTSPSSPSPTRGRASACACLPLYCGGEVLQDVRYPWPDRPAPPCWASASAPIRPACRRCFPRTRTCATWPATAMPGHPLVGADGKALGIVSVASRRPLVQADRGAGHAEDLRGPAPRRRSSGCAPARRRSRRWRTCASARSSTAPSSKARSTGCSCGTSSCGGGRQPGGAGAVRYGRDDVIGQTYPSTMPKEYVRSRLDMVRRALAGQSTHVETTVLRPNGTTFEADLRVMPFVHRGRPHALAVLRDISERRQRESELQHSEEQYRAIFNASVDAMVLRSPISASSTSTPPTRHGRACPAPR
jgi:hypothetical protein